MSIQMILQNARENKTLASKKYLSAVMLKTSYYLESPNLDFKPKKITDSVIILQLVYKYKLSMN